MKGPIWAPTWNAAAIAWPSSGNVSPASACRPSVGRDNELGISSRSCPLAPSMGSTAPGPNSGANPRSALALSLRFPTRSRPSLPPALVSATAVPMSASARVSSLPLLFSRPAGRRGLHRLLLSSRLCAAQQLPSRQQLSQHSLPRFVSCARLSILLLSELLPLA